jgi:hypothetical protein
MKNCNFSGMTLCGGWDLVIGSYEFRFHLYLSSLSPLHSKTARIIIASSSQGKDIFFFNSPRIFFALKDFRKVISRLKCIFDVYGYFACEWRVNGSRFPHLADPI